MRHLKYLLWAIAIVQLSDGPYVVSGVVQWPLAVTYLSVSGDVPGGSTGSKILLASNPATAAALASAIVSAIQADATSKGFTVPTGNTFIPSYVKQ